MTFDEIRLNSGSLLPEESANQVLSSHSDVTESNLQLKKMQSQSVKYGFSGQKEEIIKPSLSTLQSSDKSRFHSKSAPLQPVVPI